MAFNLTTFPQLEIEPGYVSRWNCVHHPIKYTGQRADAQIINFVSSSTATVCTVPFGTVPTDLVVGSTVKYISSDNTQSGEATVVNIIGNNIIFAPLGVTFTTGRLLITSRVGYFLTVRVYGVDEAYNWQLVGELELKPGALGLQNIVVNSLIKKLVEFDDRFSYAQVNKRFNTQGGRFAITYREEWQGYTGPFTRFDPRSNYYWTNGTKQLREPYNFNAGVLVTFPAGPLAKFASDFETPSMFKGFPFSLTFIYSDNLGGYAVKRVVETFNVNGGVLTAATATALDATQGSGVNRLLVDNNQPNNVETLEVWLEHEGIGTESVGYDTGTFSTGGYSVLEAEELPDEEFL